MRLNYFSLRTRIFLSMTLLVVMASVLIATVTVYQYKEQSTEYHTKRLLRKEHSIKMSISYRLKSEKEIYNLRSIDSI